MSKSKTSTTRRRLARTGLATGAATSLLAALSAAPAFATAGTMSLSATGGPSGGGNTIVATIATAPTSPNPTTFTAATAVYFAVASSATTAPTCPTTYPASPTANSTASGSPAIKLLASNKIAVTVPSGVTTQSSGTIFKYAVCSFASATSGASLIATAQYTVGAAPRIATSNAVSPVSGPALGGTTITVKGSGFVANTTAAPNNTTATIDGVPLSNINVAGDGLSFTATTPPHAPGGPYLLAVTTPGGTTSVLGTTTTKASLFNYTNGIVVSPNTAPNYSGSVDTDILGVGFSNYTFDTTSSGNTPNSTSAHVYLVSGALNETTGAGGAAGSKTKGETTECINVLVISDGELLCSFPLNHTYTNPTTGTPLISAATYAASRTVHLTTVTGSPSVTSSDANFTQADVGMPISDGATQVPAGTTITSVSSPTAATMSANAIGTSGTTASGAVNGPRALPTSGVTVTNGTTSATLTAPAGTFSASDVGRLLTSATITASSDPALAANTTITAVNSTGTTATLSAPFTVTSASVPTTLTDGVITQPDPVANGTYTVTVVNNGAVGAQAAATYQQSIISSGSTFTVADY
jgi:hypothetical protein